MTGETGEETAARSVCARIGLMRSRLYARTHGPIIALQMKMRSAPTRYVSLELTFAQARNAVRVLEMALAAGQLIVDSEKSTDSEE